MRFFGWFSGAATRPVRVIPSTSMVWTTNPARLHRLEFNFLLLQNVFGLLACQYAVNWFISSIKNRRMVAGRPVRLGLCLTNQPRTSFIEAARKQCAGLDHLYELIPVVSHNMQLALHSL